MSERERAAAEAQRARAVVTAIREQGRLGADGAGAWDRVWCRRVGWRVGAGSGALAAALLVLAVWWAPGWFERGSGADVRDVTGDVQDTPRVETAWADAGAAWVGLMDMEGTDRFDAAVAALVGRHWHDELERLRRDADPIWHSIESYWPVLEPERRDERG